MAKHVFVDSTASATAAYTLATNAAFNGNAAGLIGLWSLDLGDHIGGASAAEDFFDGTSIVPTRFQFTQTPASGMTYATGILESANVKLITHQPHVVSAKAVTTNVTINNSGSALNSATWGLKIIQRAGISDYEEFINPSSDRVDRVGKIMSYEYESDATGTVTEIANGLVAAINADAHSIVTAASGGAGQLQLTAKDYGVGFQVIDTSATTMTYASGTIVGTWGATEGYGNGWQAVMAEKKSRHHKGAYHNRLWLPKSGPELFADTAKTYDITTIVLNGGVRQDATNAKDDQIVELWIPSGWASGSSTYDSLFDGASESGTDLQIIYSA
tara:strand:- start:1491 stop:2480 length:990 start_codon:yes stop_codon:yes gene_type:complete